MYRAQTDLSYDVHRGATKPPSQRQNWWVYHYIVHIGIAFAAFMAGWFFVITLMRHSACISDQLVRREETFDLPVKDLSKGLSIGVDYGRVVIDLLESDAQVVATTASVAALSDSLLANCKLQHASGLIRISQPKYSVHNCFKGAVNAKVPGALLKEGTMPIKVVSQNGDVIVRGDKSLLHTVGDVYVKITTGTITLENIVANRITLLCLDSCEISTRNTKAFEWNMEVTHDGSWLDSDLYLRGPPPSTVAVKTEATYKAAAGSVRLRSVEFESGSSLSVTTGNDITLSSVKGFEGAYEVVTEGTVKLPGEDKAGKIGTRQDQKILLTSLNKGTVTLEVEKPLPKQTAMPETQKQKDETAANSQQQQQQEKQKPAEATATNPSTQASSQQTQPQAQASGTTGTTGTQQQTTQK
eukprot:PhF_6_TR6068/c1_g1_i1/m.8809